MFSTVFNSKPNNPKQGDLVYDEFTMSYQFYDGKEWKEVLTDPCLVSFKEGDIITTDSYVIGTSRPIRKIIKVEREFLIAKNWPENDGNFFNMDNQEVSRWRLANIKEIAKAKVNAK